MWPFQVTPAELVNLLLTYASSRKLVAVRPEQLVQACHHSYKQCTHFLDAVLQREAEQGQRICETARLTQNVEVDATFVGKWWVPSNHRLHQDQIQALPKFKARHASTTHWLDSREVSSTGRTWDQICHKRANTIVFSLMLHLTCFTTNCTLLHLIPCMSLRRTLKPPSTVLGPIAFFLSTTPP